MKLRSDFVTNSSSSSFVVIGKRVELNEIDLNNGKYYFCGTELCDGKDIVEIDGDILEFLKQHTEINWGDKYLGDTCYQLIKSYFEKNEYDDSVVTLGELKSRLKEDEEFTIINLEKDYHVSEDVLDLEERYL